MNAESVRAITLDCYGTLVQWPERVSALLDVLATRRGCTTPRADLLNRFQEHQHHLTADCYRRYATILGVALTSTLIADGITTTDDDVEWFVDGLREVPPHPEVPAILETIAKRWWVVLISNTDDDLVAATVRGLGSGVHDVVTAQQAQAYKPAQAIFRLAQQRVGATPSEIVHVGASGALDMIPAKELGIRRVWVDRQDSRTVIGEPYARISTLHDLPAVIDKINRAGPGEASEPFVRSRANDSRRF